MICKYLHNSTVLKHINLYHPILSWYRHELTQFLGKTSAASLPRCRSCNPCTSFILSPSFQAPGIVVVILLIIKSVLFTRISDLYDDMKAHTGERYGLYCIRILLHEGEQTLESVCKNTKCIFLIILALERRQLKTPQSVFKKQLNFPHSVQS